MAFKNEEIQSLDDLQVPHSLENFINDLPERYEKGEIDKEIESQMEKDWRTFHNDVKKKNSGLRKGMVTFSITMAASVSLFIGGAFISPTIAKIAASIPYLNLVFEEKIGATPLLQEINDEIIEKGFRQQDIIVSVDNTKKEVTVMVIQTEEYFNEIKSPVESLVQEILQARGNEDFNIRMLNDPETHKIFKEMRENSTEEDLEMEKVSTIVVDVLQNYGYDKGGVGVRKGRIDLENIPNTETRVNEIKTNIIEALRNKDMGEYEVKVHLYDRKAREREGIFIPIYHTIFDGLVAKTDDYKVDSAGFSSKKDYFYIEVRTTVPSSYKDIDQVVEKIEATIRDFLQSAEIQKQIQDEPYKIVIESTDKKELKVIKN